MTKTRVAVTEASGKYRTRKFLAIILSFTFMFPVGLTFRASDNIAAAHPWNVPCRGTVAPCGEKGAYRRDADMEAGD